MFDAASILEALGPWALGGIAVMVFIESGLLFPFLPGDSLLVTAGLLHQQLGLTVPIIALVAFLAAFAGDQAGYFLGSRFGSRLFKQNARVLKLSRLRETEAFFSKYGAVRCSSAGSFPWCVPTCRSRPAARGTATGASCPGMPRVRSCGASA